MEKPEDQKYAHIGAALVRLKILQKQKDERLLWISKRRALFSELARVLFNLGENKSIQDALEVQFRIDQEMEGQDLLSFLNDHTVQNCMKELAETLKNMHDDARELKSIQELLTIPWV